MEERSTIYVTQEGFEQYLKALQDYKEAYARLLKTRVEYGKNSIENYQTGAYDIEAEALLSNIRNLSLSIENMKIITDENAEENTVNMGDIVTVQFVGDDDVRRVQVVGGAPDLSRDDEVELEITDEAVRAIAKKSLERKTGARGLRSIMEKAMMDVMYRIPSDDTISKCIVTEDTIENNAMPEIQYREVKPRKPVTQTLKKNNGENA